MGAPHSGQTAPPSRDARPPVAGSLRSISFSRSSAMASGLDRATCSSSKPNIQYSFPDSPLKVSMKSSRRHPDRRPIEMTRESASVMAFSSDPLLPTLMKISKGALPSKFNVM